MIPELTRELFERHVGETFVLRAEQGAAVPVKLVRVEVAEGNQVRDQKGRVCMEGFSVYFDGSADTALPQGMYTVTNEAFGETSLFVSPVTSGSPDIRRYQAVIQRLIPS